LSPAQGFFHKPMTSHQFFATAPKAMESILAEELQALGAQNIKQTIAGVAFNGSLETAYRICLWSRIANRVFLVLSHFDVYHQDDLYQGVKNINWIDHLDPTDSFAVSFNTRNTRIINNTHFGALKVKDAIVDQMRAEFNQRPDIDIVQPDIRINVFLQGSSAQLNLDLSGESLHKRGYRNINIPAPIKENLAAAMLIRCDWPAIAEKHGSLIDPMCGSATLLIEGALIAADCAPGLLRDYYGFLGWKQHQSDCWQKLCAEAEQRKIAGMEKLPVIAGFDQSRRAVNAALAQIETAGLLGKIHIERRDINDASPAESWPPGLIICNPPYGKRLGDDQQTAELYRSFGEVLKSHFTDWRAAIIILDQKMGFRLGIRSKKPITLYNGALECKLLRMNIEPAAFFEPKIKTPQDRISHVNRQSDQLDLSPGAEMFANRLKKNLKKFSKWARRNQVNCYRIYDADLPEYAMAVDIYAGEKTWVNVQEYTAPKSIDKAVANQRLSEAIAVIPKLLDIKQDQLFLKIRSKQRGFNQYQKQETTGQFYVVEENGCLFQVNFESYLDTGLFLDHRPIRLMIQKQAKGKRFLNLFAYTGTATVHAAVGGAKQTTTIDMSATYLDWAKKNLQLNNLNGNHEFIQANCLQWLEKAAQQTAKRNRYDLIFLDPPTFSNSKRMEQTLDIQQDHQQLINNTAQLLSPGGILYFSTNYRRFKMDVKNLSHLQLEDISAQTIPYDFARNPKIHYCWKIQLS
jgi:23S rRNA (guanine2069-N7)-methyltransferase / 23S rRNA (guanine2445-N2)-methyltransferase